MAVATCPITGEPASTDLLPLDADWERYDSPAAGGRYDIEPRARDFAQTRLAGVDLPRVTFGFVSDPGRLPYLPKVSVRLERFLTFLRTEMPTLGASLELPLFDRTPGY
jgi:hypothetical protein